MRGNNFRDARKKRGITQTELSSATNIPERWIRDLERGNLKCHDADRLFSICQYLNIDFMANVFNLKLIWTSSGETINKPEIKVTFAPNKK